MKNMFLRYIFTGMILLFAGILFAAPPKVVESLSGEVIGVTDGDTITVLVNKQSIKVRLEGVDAPEFRQSFGAKSKQALSEMVFGKTVTINKTGED